MRRRYMSFQRGSGRDKYARFQRGDGLRTLMVNPGINPRRRRRRRYKKVQRGSGILNTIGTIGRQLYRSPMVRKFARDVILPTAWDVIKYKFGRKPKSRSYGSTVYNI